MKPLLQSIAVLCIFTHIAGAQTIARTYTPNVQQLEAQSVAGQQRIEQLTHQIRSLDARIERRVNNAVTTVLPLGDSQESRTRMSRIKGEILDFLRKQISDYSRRRMQLRAELDNPRRVIPEQTLHEDIARIDARIDHRIEQIIALGGSFAQHQDFDKYTATGSNWWGGTEYRVNEAYVQNKRNTRRAGEEKGKLYDAIDENVKRLEAKRNALSTRMAGQSPASQARIQQDIDRVDAIIATLEGKRSTLFSSGSNGLRPVGVKEAIQLESRAKAAATEARSDQNKIIGLYNELNRTRAQTEAVNVALASQKHAAGHQ